MFNYPKGTFAGHLCNWEVYRFVKQEEEENKREGKKVPGSYATILYELKKYLEEFGAAEQSEEVLDPIIEKLISLKLTKLETLQVINIQPKTPAELYPMVNNIEERLDEQQINEIVSLFKAPKKT